MAVLLTIGGDAQLDARASAEHACQERLRFPERDLDQLRGTRGLIELPSAGWCGAWPNGPSGLGRPPPVTTAKGAESGPLGTPWQPPHACRAPRSDRAEAAPHYDLAAVVTRKRSALGADPFPVAGAWERGSRKLQAPGLNAPGTNRLGLRGLHQPCRSAPSRPEPFAGMRSCAKVRSARGQTRVAAPSADTAYGTAAARREATPQRPAPRAQASDSVIAGGRAMTSRAGVSCADR